MGCEPARSRTHGAPRRVRRRTPGTPAKVSDRRRRALNISQHRRARARARNHVCREVACGETQISTNVIVGEGLVRKPSLSLYDFARNHERHVHALACSPNTDAAVLHPRPVVEAGSAALPLPDRLEGALRCIPLKPEAVAHPHAGEGVFRGAPSVRLPIDHGRRDVGFENDHGLSPCCVTSVNIVTLPTGFKARGA
jgi:hypothetical protein